MADSTCPKCGAPCKTEVLMRGDDHGWGTTDLQRTVYRYQPPAAPAPASTLETAVRRMLELQERASAPGAFDVARWKAQDAEAEVDALIASPAPSGMGVDERAAFEAWALSEAGGWWEAAVARVGDGYHAAAVTKQWIGWQARASLASPAPVVERCPYIRSGDGGSSYCALAASPVDRKGDQG